MKGGQYLLVLVAFLFTACIYYNVKDDITMSEKSFFSEDASAPVDSLFYQPLLKDKGKIEWDNVFKQMNECEINQLILQWSKHGVVDFTQNKIWLQNILSLAEKYQVEVVIGLYSDDKYFKVIENSRNNLRDYFQRHLRKNIQHAEQVYAIARDYKSFAGWYLYEEIDDLNYQDYSRQFALKEYLQSMAKALKTISVRSLYVSGFYSNRMTPCVYSDMLDNVIQQEYKLLLQSGIGAKLVDVEESVQYIQSFANNYKGEFTPIVEAFIVGESNITAMDFASLNRQIELVQKNAMREKVSLFSLRYFLHSTLIDSYKDRYCY